MAVFKKGDSVRLIKYPEARGIVSRITKGKYPMIWCLIGKEQDTEVAFAEPSAVELNPKNLKDE